MKRSRQAPAELGAVIAVPLENGKFGVAHVVQVAGAHAGVVMASHVGAQPSTVEEVAIEPLLREASLRNGTLDGPPIPATRWISGALPHAYARLGVRAPSAAGKRASITSYAGWENVASTILLEHLRTCDPNGAERLRATWRGERAKVERAHAKREQARVAKLTLAGLAKGTPLAAWSKRHPAGIVRAARAILRTVAREVAKARGAARTDALRRGVECFNVLDGQRGFRILTTEREDLCGAFADIARAAKMKTPADPTEKWRDW